MTSKNTQGGAGNCWMCTLPSNSLEHHRMDANIFDRTECANDHEGRVGVELCPMCHTAVHGWMRSHGHEAKNPAADAVDAVFTRFANGVMGITQKKGRKKP